MPQQTTLNISMPSTMRSFVSRRIVAGGFGNVSEYFRHLVRVDHRRAARIRVEAALLEGLESGRPLEARAKYWRRKRSTAGAGRFRRVAVA